MTMKRLATGGLLVVFLMLLGTALRPDDGTPFSATPIDAASSVSGTSHAKPLPRIPSVQDLMGTFAIAAIAVLVVVRSGTWVRIAPRRADDDAPSTTTWSSACVRRGPPALV